VNTGKYLHPEFGYLCPTPRFRHDLRVAFFSIVLGAGIGAVTVVAPSAANREGHTVSAANVSSARAGPRDIGSDAMPGSHSVVQAAAKLLPTASQVAHTSPDGSEALVAKDAERDQANSVPLPHKKPFTAASVNDPRRFSGTQKSQH
jgi:hypothetical protein